MQKKLEVKKLTFFSPIANLIFSPIETISQFGLLEQKWIWIMLKPLSFQYVITTVIEL